MGTRGAFGFRIGDLDKVTYNHFDSYPDGLGVDVLRFIRATAIDEMKEIAGKIQLVDGDSLPTPEQIEICKGAGILDLKVGTRKETDWYCLMRGAQGDLNIYKTVPFMLDNGDFLGDSLFCEWAYIINLDKNVLEVYRGFNKNPYAAGRYAASKQDEYSGVVWILDIPLEQARTMTDDEFLEMVGKLTSASKE